MAAYAQLRDLDTGVVRPDFVLRTCDGAYLPTDGAATDGRAYRDWLAAGNVPDPPPSWTVPVRQALGSALRDALKAQGWSAAWQAALSGQSQDTRDWWAAHYDDRIPIDALKLVRLAKACSPPVDLQSLFTAAGA